MTPDRPTGVRVNAVQQGVVPPYAYSVGLEPIAGYELICAGALRYRVDEVGAIIQACASELARADGQDPTVAVSLGAFRLGPVHGDWLSGLMASGDRTESGDAWRQLIPTSPPSTVDVPDLGAAPSDGLDPAWRWLHRDWDLGIPKESHLVTTLDVLSGCAPITVFRWELDQWEALDRPATDVNRANARVVPIGVLSAIVSDWSPFLRLTVGEGLKRVAGGWRPA